MRAFRAGAPARYTLLDYTPASLRKSNYQAIGSFGQAFERSAVEAIADVMHAAVAQDESTDPRVPTAKSSCLDGVSENARCAAERNIVRAQGDRILESGQTTAVGNPVAVEEGTVAIIHMVESNLRHMLFTDQKRVAGAVRDRTK